MSSYTYVRITCDTPRCDERVEEDKLNGGGLNVSWAKRLAELAGWQVNGSVAHCPEHRTTPLNFHAYVKPPYGGLCDATLDSGRHCWRPDYAYIHKEVNP